MSSKRAPVGNGRRVAKLLLAVGFLAVAVATAFARMSPAQGYELSLYRATPVETWIGLGIALLVALGVGIGTARAELRHVATGLLFVGILAVIAQPTIRGYAFYGMGDALTYVGWMRDIDAGRIASTELLYPGIHVVSLLVHAVTGLTIEHASLLIVYAFGLLFVAGTGLVVRELTEGGLGFVLGAFSGAMFLPLNTITTNLVIHPNAITLLFVPFVLFVLVRYLDPAESTSRVRPIGVLLGACTIAATLYHPQQAANLLALFVGISLIQIVGRRTNRFGRDEMALHAQTGVFAIVFGLWSSQHDRTTGSVESLVSGLLERPESLEAGDRGASLVEIGGSITEIFLKVFLVDTLFLALSGLVVVAILLGGRARGRDVPILYLAAGTIPPGVLFVLYAAADAQVIYFRHLSFIMVLATIIGAVGLYRAFHASSRRMPKATTGSAVVIVAVLVVLSVPVFFPSPYVYQSSAHVTEMQFHGHETAFEHGTDEYEIHGIRQGPGRYEDAILGTGDLTPREIRQENSVSGETLDGSLVDAYDDPTYLVVTKADREREVTTYRELRYSETALDTVGDERGVHRVQDNGEFELYLIQGDRTAAQE